MTDTAQNNRRIAKNTLLLYFRMLFMMGVTLYTSRVVLNTLGVEDYGIYNVVGGVVLMFGFLNGAMSTCTQRYITFALGKGNIDELKKVFSNCVLTHIFISLIVLILSESIGLWLLYNKMQIPDARIDAAFWVFQCAVGSTIILIMSVPYNADIVAHEKMSAFAYISVIEAILKLLIVYLLAILPFDNLVLYAVLLLMVQCFIRFIYGLYCKRHFIESKVSIKLDKKLFKEMVGFASWSLWGNAASVIASQGLNILLNMFFGPIVNAARGVAVQAQTAVFQLAMNFQMAINPQITKKYASGDFEELYKLIYRSSKFTFCLLLVLALPIIMETHFILTLWLKNVPIWSCEFLRLSIVIIMIDALANPLSNAASATGKIKKYQSIIGSILLAILPISYIALKMGGNPLSVYMSHLSIVVVALFARLWLLKNMIRLSMVYFLKKVLYKCIKVIILSLLMPLLLKIFMSDSAINSVIIIIVSGISAIVASYILGLTPNERVFVNNKIQLVIARIFNDRNKK